MSLLLFWSRRGARNFLGPLVRYEADTAGGDRLLASVTAVNGQTATVAAGDAFQAAIEKRPEMVATVARVSRYEATVG